jgi:hypothetical protein
MRPTKPSAAPVGLRGVLCYSRVPKEVLCTHESCISRHTSCAQSDIVAVSLFFWRGQAEGETENHSANMIIADNHTLWLPSFLFASVPSLRSTSPKPGEPLLTSLGYASGLRTRPSYCTTPGILRVQRVFIFSLIASLVQSEPFIFMMFSAGRRRSYLNGSTVGCCVIGCVMMVIGAV